MFTAKQRLTIFSFAAVFALTLSSLVFGHIRTARAVSLIEAFDGSAPPTGWTATNLSNPLGTIGWFKGNPTVFPAYSGATDSYIGANFNNTGSIGDISNWLITPLITSLKNGDTISFYTRTVDAPQYADRLRMYISTNGSCSPGATSTSTGDFTTALLTINETLVAANYPNTWTQYSVTLSGISGTVSGCVGFRYDVTAGGSGGTNSDYIGIDDFVYTDTSGPTLTPSPTATATNTALPSYMCSGQLSSASPVFTRPIAGNPPLALSTTGTSVYYNTLTFMPSVTGSYTITMNASFDGFYVLYSPSFNPAAGLTNALQAVDDVVGDDPQIVRTLNAGTTYILVSTSFGNGATGTYTNSIQPNTVSGDCGAPTPTPGATNTPTATRTHTPTATATMPMVTVDTIGIYKEAVWLLRNSNTAGPADISVVFGNFSDLPVTGDWDNNGQDTIGLFRNSEFILSNSNTSPAANINFHFGNPGDLPLDGRWQAGQGDRVGVFRSSNGLVFLRNTLTTGVADTEMIFGNPGDTAMAGDWNGDGVDTIGVYRSSNMMWYLSNANTPGVVFADVTFAAYSTINAAMVGDWDGNSTSTVANYNGNTGVVQMHNANSNTPPALTFAYGPGGSFAYYPLSGKWALPSAPGSASQYGIVQAGAVPSYNDANGSGAD
jgi:hypothetical protein